MLSRYRCRPPVGQGGQRGGQRRAKGVSQVGGQLFARRRRLLFDTFSVAPQLFGAAGQGRVSRRGVESVAFAEAGDLLGLARVARIGQPFAWGRG